MMLRTISSGLVAVATVAWIPGAAMPAPAGSTGNGTVGSGFSQYTFEADANRLCKCVTVVWGSSANQGVYFLQSHGPYSATGRRVDGFYACVADVKKAGYKIE
jgi:hypothetical protein